MLLCQILGMRLRTAGATSSPAASIDHPPRLAGGALQRAAIHDLDARTDADRGLDVVCQLTGGRLARGALAAERPLDTDRERVAVAVAIDFEQVIGCEAA